MPAKTSGFEIALIFTPVIPFCTKNAQNASDVHHQFVTPPSFSSPEPVVSWSRVQIKPSSSGDENAPPYERFHSRACGQLLCKFMATKESVYIRRDKGEKSSIPIIGLEHQNDRRLVLFWNTNMTVVTSCEDTLKRQTLSHEKLREKLSFQTKDLRSVLNRS